MHHLMRAYGAAGHDVVYVDGPRGLGRGPGWAVAARHAGRLVEVADGVHNLTLGPAWPGFERRDGVGRIARALSHPGLLLTVRAALRGHGFVPDVTMLLQMPLGRGLWGIGPARALRVYYCFDLPGYRAADEPALALERETVRGADVVFTSSPAHRDRLQSLHLPTFAFGHAVDARWWDEADKTPPGWLSARPGPRVLYLGPVNDRLDLGLVHDVARAMRDVTFVFVGPVDDKAPGVRALRGLDHVHFAGALPHRDVPAVLAHVDAVWLPYARGPNQRHIGVPLKLYEVFIAGRAVVATRFSDLGEAEPEVHFADAPAATVSALRRVLVDPGAGRAGRERLARDNTYARRVEEQHQRLATFLS